MWIENVLYCVRTITAHTAITKSRFRENPTWHKIKHMIPINNTQTQQYENKENNRQLILDCYYRETYSIIASDWDSAKLCAVFYCWGTTPSYAHAGTHMRAHIHTLTHQRLYSMPYMAPFSSEKEKTWWGVGSGTSQQYELTYLQPFKHLNNMFSTAVHYLMLNEWAH